MKSLSSSLGDGYNQADGIKCRNHGDWPVVPDTSTEPDYPAGRLRFS